MRKDTNPDIRFEMSPFFEVEGKRYNLSKMLTPLLNVENENEISHLLRSNAEIPNDLQITPILQYLNNGPSLEQNSSNHDDNYCEYYITNTHDAIKNSQTFSRWLFVNLSIVKQFYCAYFTCQELLTLSSVHDDKSVSLVFRLLSAVCQMESAISLQNYEEREFFGGTAEYYGLVQLQNGFFQEFSELYCGIQCKYGYTSSSHRKVKATNSNSQMKKRDRNAPKQIPISKLYYWDNDAILPHLKDCLINFACNNRGFDVSEYITVWDIKGFAVHILSQMDIVTNQRLDDARLIIDSIEKKQIWICDNWNTAIFLWLYTDLIMGKEYRQCAMCGRLFPIGKQPNKKYCDLHDGAAIDYFNRIRREKAESFLKEKPLEESNSQNNSIEQIIDKNI